MCRQFDSGLRQLHLKSDSTESNLQMSRLLMASQSEGAVHLGFWPEAVHNFIVVYARVAQWWSVALPRRRSRVRSPFRAFYILRGCWNWQTGKTKDLVGISRVGSSPIPRTSKYIKGSKWLK